MGIEQFKRLTFDYRMTFEYSEPAAKCFFTMKSLARSTARQQVEMQKTELLPAVPVSMGVDSFGNPLVYGSVRTPHKSFGLHVCGQIYIGQILYEEKAAPNDELLYRHPYGMNRPGRGILEYFENIRGMLEDNVYVNAVYLMRRLHEDFAYSKGVTDVKTCAEEAWIGGRGVCQDFVHIYLALCHLAGIPARYVTGVMLGEGESHAWAEILYHGKWIGMDPTNDILVARSHIKFGQGRDAADCLINRGILRGGGEQKQTIRVIVTEY